MAGDKDYPAREAASRFAHQAMAVAPDGALRPLSTANAHIHHAQPPRAATQGHTDGWPQRMGAA
jgi:hypothetical protein